MLNEAREGLEEIIDTLHAPHIGTYIKPRTYRNCARKDYLNLEKKKKLTAKKIHKAMGQQLRYIRRDLKIIEKLTEKSPLTLLNKRQYRKLLVCHEVYRQQIEMRQKKNHQIANRIVSLHMPFVRPIVRGKAGADVEFGAKLTISIVNGFSFMEHLSFNAFNEGITLIQSIKNFRQRFGFDPEAVFADKFIGPEKTFVIARNMVFDFPVLR